MEDNKDKLTAEDVMYAGLGVLAFSIDKCREVISLMIEEGKKFATNTKDFAVKAENNINNEIKNIEKINNIKGEINKITDAVTSTVSDGLNKAQELKGEVKRIVDSAATTVVDGFNKAKELGEKTFVKLKEDKLTLEGKLKEEVSKKEMVINELKTMAEKDINEIAEYIKGLVKKD